MGDEGRRTEEFGVFGDSLRTLHEKWGVWSTSARAIVRAVEPRVGLRGALEALLAQSEAVKKRKAQNKTQGRLTDEEFEAIYSLEKAGNGKPLLLIADDLHQWDERSLNLLHRIRDEDLASAFPFLQDIRVLAVWTTSGGAPPDAHEGFHSLLRTRVEPVVELEYCSRSEFPDTLTQLGLERSLPAELLDKLYAACGGHLVLMKEIVEVLNEQDEFIGIDDGDDNWDDSNLSWAQKIFSLRVRRISEELPQLSSALECAAIIGSRTSRKELRCLTELQPPIFDSILDRASDLRILEEWDDTLVFTHDWFRDALSSNNPTRKRHLHRKFAECLRLVRPGDYATRSFHLRAAGDEHEADVFLILALLHSARTASDLTESLKGEKEDLLERREQLGGFLLSMLSAYEEFASANFEETISITREIRRPTNKLLQAELDYLHCLTRGFQKTTRGREVALTQLEQWSELSKEEPELGTRTSMLSVYLLMHLGELEEAREREKDITTQLLERAEWDQAARYQLEVLNRRSDSIYQSDVVIGRLKSAVSYFGPGESQDVPRSHLEYFRSLNNLAATLISLSRYQEAHEELQKLSPLAESLGVEAFQRPEYAVNNLVLSGVRANELDIERAIEVLREISDRDRTETDNFLMRNNLGVMLTHVGDIDEAHDVFEQTLEELQRFPEPEPYFLYLLGTNLAGVRHALDRDEAKDLWDRYSGYAEDIGGTSRDWHKERVEAFEGVFEEIGPDQIRDFEWYAIRQHPDKLGPGWDHYGRGFQATGIHIWAEV